MKIKGHSNFDVKLETINGEIVVSKSSDKEDYKRLLKQIEKQNIFLKKYSKKFNVKTPKVIKNIENKFYMEYIYFSENFIDFIQTGNIRKTNWFLKKIYKIVECYLQECSYQNVKKGILKDKIDLVKKNLLKNNFIDFENSFIQKSLQYLYENFKKIEGTKIPIGNCHGDLTFSNILIDSSNMDIYLIDFLDSFIESPILDIVKIRQDTKFFWICNMYSDNFDKNNINLTLHYMDNKIVEYFSKYDFFEKTYDFFEKLNILRILQYSKDINLLNYLKV